MDKVRKYRRGEQVKSIAYLAERLRAGYWFYYGERPKHPHFLRCMTLEVLEMALAQGLIYEAIKNEGRE